MPRRGKGSAGSVKMPRDSLPGGQRLNAAPCKVFGRDLFKYYVEDSDTVLFFRGRHSGFHLSLLSGYSSNTAAAPNNRIT